jgi:hypothetical protein
MTRVTVLHGGLSPSMRRAATAAFVSGERRLLLATDAGGEGLNLHARCRAVIDVELPWNPLRLEQRIGRVDRLGQQRRVHALHLVHAGSVEDTVLAHLHRRMARVDAASTNARDNDLEARVADAVLGGSTATLAIPEWRSDSLPAALDEAQRLEHLRRLQGNTTPGVATDVPVSLPRRRDGPVRTAHCTFAVTISERSGRAISDVIVPLSIALSPTLPSERAGRIRSLHGIADHAVSQPLVQAFVRETLRTEQTARDAFIDAVRARVQALREALRREGGYAFQPALFDGRATRAATDRAAVLEIHRAHLERVESALGTPGDLVAGTPRLVGISVLS